MSDDKSGELTHKTTAFNQEMIRSLQGMTTMYPIFSAFGKWLRRINGAIETLEDVNDQNNQIFSAFMFLLNNDYLFYLTITSQFTVINDLFEKHGVPIQNSEIFQEIGQSYDLAIEHRLIPRIENNVTQDMMNPTNLEEGYFQIETSQYDLYNQLRKQYKHLHYKYQSEQTQAIRQVYNEFIKQNIESLRNDTNVPEHVKELLVNAHNEFEIALSELENELRDLGNASTALDPEMFSYDELPTLEDFFERHKEQEPNENDDDFLKVPEYLQTIGETDVSEDEQISRPFDSFSSSRKRKENERGAFSDVNKTTEPERLVPPTARPGNQKLRELIGKFNRIDEIYQEQRSRHGSLSSHYDRHRRATINIKERLAFLERRYNPALEHLSQKQELALNDIKVDIGKFNKLLLSNLASIEPIAKFHVMKSIKKMEEIERTLLNAETIEVAQAALTQYKKELDTLFDLFQPSGALISIQLPYQELRDNLDQKVVSPPSDQDDLIGHVEKPEINPQPKYRRFAVKKMEIEYKCHEDSRFCFFDKSKSTSKSTQEKIKITKHSHDELFLLHSDEEKLLKNQIKLLKGTLIAKQEGLSDKIETFQSVQSLIAIIEQQDYKKINLLDLHSLVMKLNELLPDNKHVSDLEALTLQIREQSGFKKSH